MSSEKRRRNTPQRRVILEELCALKSHPTAAELFEIVRRRLPRISLGTVYRNLEVLHQDGSILKIDTAGTEARFDGATHAHCHIRCARCGCVRDIDVDLPIDPIGRITDARGFRVDTSELRFVGECPECRDRGPQREIGTHPMH